MSRIYKLVETINELVGDDPFRDHTLTTNIFVIILREIRIRKQRQLLIQKSLAADLAEANKGEKKKKLKE